MVPIVGVFAAAAVAGVGATLGHRLAKDLILPWVERTGGQVGKFGREWADKAAARRRAEYSDYAAPEPAAAADAPADPAGDEPSPSI